MTVKKLPLKGVLYLWLSLFTLTDGYSATLSLRCSVTSTRSSITLTASGLPRIYYYGIAYSGNFALRSKLPNKLPNTNGVVVFNFDSAPAAVAAGATQIASNYIKNRTVYGYIRQGATNYLIGGAKGICS